MTRRISLMLILGLVTSVWGIAKDTVYLKIDNNDLRLGNDSVELTLDAHSGYFRQIVNKTTGIKHKKPEDGVWPFGLTVGTREQPVQLRAEIRADGKQRMTYTQSDRANGGKHLSLTYPMLVDNATSKPTGVALGVTIDLPAGRDYFIVHAEIANNGVDPNSFFGPFWVTNFYAGHGEILTGDDSRTSETIWVPARGGASFKNFSYTSLGLPTYAWGWGDYSGMRGGMGFAYVNRQGIQWTLDWKKTADGLLQGWHLFDTHGYWHFEGLMNDHQKSLLIQPLEAGNSFTTDEWLIVPHAGDWHRTADAYRERYMEVFKGDYLDWEHVPERVKKLRVRFGMHVCKNTYPRSLYNRLDSVAPQVRAAIAEIGTDPKQVGLTLVNFHPHVGRFPEFFPIAEAAGGEKSWETMMRDLRSINLAYVAGYTHLSLNHPAAKNYVPEADTADTIPSWLPMLGKRACVDNAAWANRWEEELIPAYKTHGFNAIFADEGHFPWGTCAATGPAHLHGQTSVGILTGNTRGILRLHKLFHEGLGQGSVIEVEGSGDVSGRWADLNMAYPDPAVAYTLPFKRFAWVLDAQTPEPTLRQNANLCLAHGYALMVNLRHDEPIKDFGPLRQYVQLRKRLDDAGAPGYPEGFRDTVGLTVSDPALVAKGFSSKDGITIIYYAKKRVSGEIAVDCDALGRPQLQLRHIPVKLDQDMADFMILH